MEKENHENKVLGSMEKAVDRRAFVRGVGVAGLGIAGAALVIGKLGLLDALPGAGLSGLRASRVHAQNLTDTDILNFALNLEYLEAEFYTVATTGQTIDQIGIGIDGTGTPGQTTGGKRVDFDGDEDNDEDDELNSKIHRIAKEVAADEQHHVVLLRTALGSAAIAKPAINLDALGFGFRNVRQFLKLARAFEDVGVSAYGGAAPLISSKDILATAARIALTEALHAGNIRLWVDEKHVQTQALDAKDVLPPPSGQQFFPVDDNALTMVRTPSEVLAIAYGNSTAGTPSGGFFPNGVNGTIIAV
jgi:hypothetical protein